MFTGNVLRRSFSVCLVAGAIASCGGGGSSPTPTPTPTNSAPQFTSGSAATVAENSTGTVYTAAATDADGDSVSFALSGDDAAAFRLSGADLSFSAPPNFDAYADADRDNVYTVVLTVSDGRGGSTMQTVDVTVTNDREGISVKRIATGFDDPVGMTSLFARILLVAESDGTVWNVDGGAETKAVASEETLPAGAEVLDIAGGAIGATPTQLVVAYRDPTGISLRYNVGTTATRTETKLVAGPPGAARAKVGYSTADFHLYAAVGDPSGDRAQGSSGYGGLFFFDSSSRPSQIGIGIRQPGGFFNLGSNLYLADQGGSEQHEIDLINLSAPPINFGWPFFEGTAQLKSGAPAGLFDPAFTYPFGNGPMSGQGIVMGALYKGGGGIASLQNQLVFGDTNGSIFVVGNFADGTFENRSEDFKPDVGTIDHVVKIINDANGFLYILDSDGELFRVDGG